MSAPRLWVILGDVPQTAMCIPSIDSVVPKDKDTWTGRFKVHIGPISFDMVGTVTLLEKVPDDHRLSLGVEVDDSRTGGLHGAITVSLGAFGTGSLLIVQIDVQFSGRIDALGQPFVEQKAREALEQFAENLGQRAAQAF